MVTNVSGRYVNGILSLMVICIYNVYNCIHDPDRPTQMQINYINDSFDLNGLDGHGREPRVYAK